MSEEEAADFEGDIPLMSPVQIIGGGIRIAPNENLDTDQVVVTFEALAMVPTEAGPQLGLLPILMDPSVWQHLVDNLVDETPEEEEE